VINNYHPMPLVALRLLKPEASSVASGTNVPASEPHKQDSIEVLPAVLYH
jgi:hypothetical protein